MENSKARTYFLLALLIGSTVLTFFVFRPFLTTLALAAILAVILYPLHRRILARFSSWPGLSSLLTVVIACLLIIVPLAIIGTVVINQSQHAYTSFVSGANSGGAQEVINRVGTWLNPYIPGAANYANTLSLELSTYAQQGLQWLLERAGSAFASIVGVVLRLFILLMALYYFLRNGKELEDKLITRSFLKDEEGRTIARQMSRTITSVVKGSLVIALIQGTLAGIGYFLFGIPEPALWGVSTSISALIPGVGTSLVLVPAILYLFIVGNIAGGIGLALWSIFLVGLIDNFLAPKIMGTGAKLNPLLMLLSVVGGLLLYGPVGIFLGPLTVSFLFAVYTLYARD